MCQWSFYPAEQLRQNVKLTLILILTLEFFSFRVRVSFRFSLGDILLPLGKNTFGASSGSRTLLFGAYHWATAPSRTISLPSVFCSKAFLLTYSPSPSGFVRNFGKDRREMMVFVCYLPSHCSFGVDGKTQLAPRDSAKYERQIWRIPGEVVKQNFQFCKFNGPSQSLPCFLFLFFSFFLFLFLLLLHLLRLRLRYSGFHVKTHKSEALG